MKSRKLTLAEFQSLKDAQIRYSLAREYLNGVSVGLGLDPQKAYNISPAGEVSEMPQEFGSNA